MALTISLASPEKSTPSREKRPELSVGTVPIRVLSCFDITILTLEFSKGALVNNFLSLPETVNPLSGGYCESHDRPNEPH